MLSIHLRSVVTVLLAGLFSTLLVAQQPLDNSTPAGQEKDPVLRADGGELFFSRAGDPSNQGRDNAADIWIRTRYPDGTWGRAINPGSPINSFAHDHPLALNADGTRLVVLRNGLTNYFDLLERKERNWRIVQSWPLPEGVYPRIDLTFDLNGQRIVYSAFGSGGTLDLYERKALPDGKWSSAKPLTLLNGPDHTTSPKMAADGRTLFFRRADQWWMQTDRDERAKVTTVSARIQEFALSVDAGTEEAIVVLGNSGNEARLLKQRLPADVYLPKSRLVRGYLGVPPEPGTTTVLARLENGADLEVYPDAFQRYELFLREGEDLLTDAVNATFASASGAGVGGLASTTDTRSLTDQDRLRLERSIASREQSLQQLDAERRRYDLAIPKETDPELEALRARLELSRGTVDTLPPQGNSVKDKYARELQELELMKAKFRRQQEEKLRERSGSTAHPWTEKTAAPTPADRTAAIPSIAESYTPLVRQDPAAVARAARQDSAQVGAAVRSGLYPDYRPKVYEREPWENTIRNDLPRTEPISAEESARLDVEYQRQQAELAALRAQLNRLNETTPVDPRTNWTAKGSPGNLPSTPTTAAPTAYGRTQYPPVPASSPSRNPAPSNTPGISAGISFIANTAYPDGAGYTGLDQLVKQLGQRVDPLELRVHTPADMDRRAAQILSEERARTIRDHLIEQGIPAHLFQVVGFGNNLTGSGGERVEVLVK